MNKTSRIFVAGHRGLVGSAILKVLRNRGFSNLLLRTGEELDLTVQADVERFFHEESPEVVFLAAAKVGGILANTNYPADFIYENLMIQSNVINCSAKFRVEQLLFLGSSCIYPKACPQPIKEEYLLSGPLETTNEAYAVAKIAGIKMCRFYNQQYGTKFIGVMPCNLYGPNDNFNPETSHVLAALLDRIHTAKVSRQPQVVVWGSGRPRREFLHVDDLAEACLFLMEHESKPEVINVGTGRDLSIVELAELIKDIVGYTGRLTFDSTKPDGTYQKLLDLERIDRLGWKSRITLQDGIRETYEWYLANIDQARI